MIYDVITRTGAIYRIDLEKGFWSKHRYYGEVCYSEISMEKIWSMMVGTTLQHPHNDPDNWEYATFPVVGKHLHLSAKRIWYTSTEVQHIVEVEHWDDFDSPITNPESLKNKNDEGTNNER